MPESRGYRWKNVGARIKEGRLTAGLTQGQLAQLVDVAPHTVWCWESGRMKPSADNLVQLAYRLRVSGDWLLDRDVVEDELLKETNVSFMDAVAGLPQEDLDSILNFIRFVREERTRKQVHE